MEKQTNIQKQEEKDRVVERASDRPVYAPHADIHETDKSFILATDIPGVDEKSIDITVEKNVLHIHGRIDDKDTAPEGFVLRHSEYGVGDYHRSFSLTNEIDQGKIEASLKNGVLRLVLPKTVPETKRIMVKAS